MYKTTYKIRKMFSTNEKTKVRVHCLSSFSIYYVQTYLLINTHVASIQNATEDLTNK